MTLAMFLLLITHSGVHQLSNSTHTNFRGCRERVYALSRKCLRFIPTTFLETARNCLTYMLDYIVMQMRKVNRDQLKRAIVNRVFVSRRLWSHDQSVQM